MNEAVAIEQSRELNKPSRSFDEKLVTDEQLANEMTHTMVSAMPCKRKDA